FPRSQGCAETVSSLMSEVSRFGLRVDSERKTRNCVNAPVDRRPNFEQNPTNKEATSMLTKIRHVAIHTDDHFRMAHFYKTLFGMKKITAGMTDQNGNYDKERGHLSDGVIGLALLQRQPGISAGLDHFGLEVEDVQKVRDRLKQYYPEVFVAESQSHVPFAGLRTHDPDGNQFDLSQKGMANVREGYLQEGWDQPRWINHIAI